jgi:hypothetical protein
VVGASALIGSSVAPPVRDGEPPEIRLAVAATADVATPNSLLAARAENAYPTPHTSTDKSAAIAALIAGFTTAINAELAAVHAGVGLGKAAAAHFAGATTVAGVVTIKALAAAFLAALDALTPFDGTPAPELPDHPDIGVALAALIGGMAAAINAGIIGWDAAVHAGAAVVTHFGAAAAATGVAINNTLTGALLTAMATFGAIGGPLTAPVAAATVALLGGFSTAINTGMVGLGAALGWKAALDASLADLVTQGGVAIVNTLTAGLLTALGAIVPPPPGGGGASGMGAGLAELIGGAAAAIKAGIIGWDTAVHVGAALVTHIATTAAATGVGINSMLTGAVLTAIAAFGTIGGPTTAPVATAAAALVGGFSAAVNTGTLAVGAAVGWKAGLDASLADLVTGVGVGVTDAVAGGVQGVLDSDEPPPTDASNGQPISIAAQTVTRPASVTPVVETSDNATPEPEPQAPPVAAAQVEEATTPPERAKPADDASPGVNTDGDVKKSTGKDGTHGAGRNGESTKSSDGDDENGSE